MATERIDVKAEAERIVDLTIFVGNERRLFIESIIALASRVRKAAIRETVERCIEIVKQQFAAGRRPEIERVLRAAFSEPGNCSESPNGSPATLRQFVDAAVSVAECNVKSEKAFWGADKVHIPSCVCDVCTILRLAPQFKEKTNE